MENQNVPGGVLIIGIAAIAAVGTLFFLMIHNNDEDVVENRFRKRLAHARALAKRARQASDNLRSEAEDVAGEYDELDRPDVPHLSRRILTAIRTAELALALGTKRRVWLDRFVAFAIGVASSLAATWILSHVTIS